MSDNIYQVPGSGQIVNLKYLYERIENLEGTLERMKRTYEDLLYNLDFDNFEPKSTRKPIESTIKEVYPDGMGNMSSIEVNAQKIATKVSADFNEAVSVDAAASADMQAYLDGMEKDKLYYRKADGTYWFWNTVTEKWAKSSSMNLYSAFTQTAAGFKMKGDLETITQEGKRMTVSDSYIRMYGDSTDQPKVQVGFIVNHDSAYEQLNGEFPQIILGAGAEPQDVLGQSTDQLVIQKLENGATIFYRPEKSQKLYQIWFTRNGVDFSLAAAQGLETSQAESHNHGIPDGTWLQTADGGAVKWTASGAHMHSVRSTALRE